MNFDKQRYITLPTLKYLADQNLRYTDILTYTALKSFNNYKDDLCYPSYETIAEISGTNTMFVRESLLRLQAANLIQIKKSTSFRKPNKYWFNDIASYSKVPFDFLKINDLSVNEKAMLLCLHQSLSKNGQPQPKMLINYSTTLGIGLKTIERHYQGLIKKKYIEESNLTDHNGNEKIYSVLTDKVNWLPQQVVATAA